MQSKAAAPIDVGRNTTFPPLPPRPPAPTTRQVNALVDRPELPRLASSPLLVRAYDLGLVGPDGKVDAAGVRRLLAARRHGPFKREGFFGLVPRAQRQVGCWLAGALLGRATHGDGSSCSMQQRVLGAGGKSAMHACCGGGARTFALLVDRFTGRRVATCPQAATVLLARLLAWKRVQRVVAGNEALQVLLLAGRPGAGLSSLMELLSGAGRAWRSGVLCVCLCAAGRCFTSDRPGTVSVCASSGGHAQHVRAQLSRGFLVKPDICAQRSSS
jgi:hypothetical protein